MDNPEGQVTYLNSSSDGRATYRLWHERACVAFLSCVCNDIKKTKQTVTDTLRFYGGPEEIRTLDLSDANRTLSQLSYRPKYSFCRPEATL